MKLAVLDTHTYDREAGGSISEAVHHGEVALNLVGETIVEVFAAFEMARPLTSRPAGGMDG